MMIQLTSATPIKGQEGPVVFQVQFSWEGRLRHPRIQGHAAEDLSGMNYPWAG